MGKKVKNMLKIIATAMLLLISFYFGIRSIAVIEHGYSWEEMDWDRDGKTTLGEFFDASDTGKRIITENGKECIEYFAYKDALPVKTVCPK
jgi:hypothetical protein